MGTTETRWIMAKVFEVTAGMNDRAKEEFYRELIWELQDDFNKAVKARWLKDGLSFRSGMVD